MQALIALAAEKAAEALLKGSCILILGGRTTNFPDHLRCDPRLVFWDSTDQDTQRTKPVPENTGLVLLTRFITHKLTIRVRADCERIGAPVIGPLSTGLITNLLEEAIDELREDAAAAITEVVLQEQRPDYTELPVFLVDQIPGNALGSDLLSSDATLEQLRQKAEQRWPGIPVQRVRRALRHALYELGLFEGATSELGEEDSPPTDEKPDEQSTRVAQLEKQLHELQTRLASASGECRKQKETIRRLERESKGKDENLKLVTQCCVDVITMLESLGIPLAFHPNIAERMMKIMKTHTGSPS